MHGLGSADKFAKVINEICYLNCDVFLLQETHVCCKNCALQFEKLWKGQCFWSFGTGTSAGVPVLFSQNFSGKIIRFLFDPNGRILSLLAEFNNLFLNIVNIYSPNVVTDRKAFFPISIIIFFRKVF